MQDDHKEDEDEDEDETKEGQSLTKFCIRMVAYST